MGLLWRPMLTTGSKIKSKRIKRRWSRRSQSWKRKANKYYFFFKGTRRIRKSNTQQKLRALYRQRLTTSGVITLVRAQHPARYLSPRRPRSTVVWDLIGISFSIISSCWICIFPWMNRKLNEREEKDVLTFAMERAIETRLHIASWNREKVGPTIIFWCFFFLSFKTKTKKIDFSSLTKLF